MSTPTLERLTALPRSERREALQSLVVAELKAALLMTDRDELPLDANYFDFGITSLRIVDIEQHLEEELGCSIDTALLFSSPTVEALMAHLTAEALPTLFADHPPGTASSPPATIRPLVDSLLKQLYDA